MKKKDNYIEEAIDNIRKDREITKSLLNDLISYLGVDESRHGEVGTIAAKYVETLQRSNEQLVKVAALIQKQNEKSSGLSDIDKSEIFDLLSESDNVK
jgi:hypothetical protein